MFFMFFARSECSGNPVKFFAILTNQRSGSGWFETLLNSHINVSSNGEIFSVTERRVNVSTIVQTLDKVYNLDWLSSASKNECSAAIGFKWMLNQVTLLTVMYIKVLLSLYTSYCNFQGEKVKLLLFVSAGIVAFVLGLGCNAIQRPHPFLIFLMWRI